MSLQEVQAFTSEVRVGFLATTDGKCPSVRPMAGCTWVDGELWMSTGRTSAKATDIRATGRAEICFLAADYRHLRIAGACRVSEDPGDKERLYRLVPEIAQHVSGPADPEYVVLRLRPASARRMGADWKYTELLVGRE